MKHISLSPLFHRERLQIAIRFPFDEEIKDYLKKFPGICWSRTHHTFYLQHSEENTNRLFNYLVAKKWKVDKSSLYRTEGTGNAETKAKELLTRESKKRLWQYVAFLRGKRLSESSVRTYYNSALKFVKFLNNKSPQEITKRDVELFVEQRIAANHYAISTHRQCISAIKHFLMLYNCEQLDLEEITRPAKSRFLPVVLAKEETIALLTATRNLKHRAILAMIYSSGLRIGELLNLKLEDIDIARRQVFIRNSKGRKDRVVILASSILPLLNNYLATYAPRTFFAEGAPGGVYSAQSIRAFLKRSCHRAGIKKRVTPHTLRHSYATHMLENGIDIRYIQTLLGHSKPETTMIYTHVSRKDVLRIESPLDVTVKEMRQTSKEHENMLLSRGNK